MPFTASGSHKVSLKIKNIKSENRWHMLRKASGCLHMCLFKLSSAESVVLPGPVTHCPTELVLTVPPPLVSLNASPLLFLFPCMPHCDSATLQSLCIKPQSAAVISWDKLLLQSLRARQAQNHSLMTNKMNDHVGKCTHKDA